MSTVVQETDFAILDEDVAYHILSWIARLPFREWNLLGDHSIPLIGQLKPAAENRW
jgi:hypothetical protein